MATFSDSEGQVETTIDLKAFSPEVIKQESPLKASSNNLVKLLNNSPIVRHISQDLKLSYQNRSSSSSSFR